MQENYHKWLSQYIGKEFEMLVFGTDGIPVIFFPPADARYYTAKDSGLVSSLSEFIENEKIKLYCPDSYDNESWYNFSAEPRDRVKNYLHFESLIIHDLIGFVKFETQRNKVILAGLEFGGYHALNFALKHPNMVSGVISVEGFFDIKKFIYGYYDDDCYFNNPPDYLPSLDDEWYIDKLKKISIHLAAGISGDVTAENQYISSLLQSKDIKVNFTATKNTDLWKTSREILSSILQEQV
jgi:esterase/lipase superfamily enzyme